MRGLIRNHFTLIAGATSIAAGLNYTGTLRDACLLLGGINLGCWVGDFFVRRYRRMVDDLIDLTAMQNGLLKAAAQSIMGSWPKGGDGKPYMPPVPPHRRNGLHAVPDKPE